MERSRLAWPWGGIVVRICLPALLSLAAGCTADRPIHIRIDPNVRRPNPAAVVFFVDGFGERQFEEALAENRVPNIAQHIMARGVRVEAAVSCLPSITYANATSFITGRLTGHHGIVANRWFEPSTGRFQDYCLIRTYQLVDRDYTSSPTIYDILRDRVSVNIQLAVRRGVTHDIDNWMSSGVNWFFHNHVGTDCLVAQQFEFIGEETRSWGRWPDLILVYFPAADHMAHQFGPRSAQYRAAIANVDVQVGRVCEALREIGMYDRTYLCLVSDHGMVEVGEANVFDVPAVLASRTGKRVWVNRLTERGDEAQVLRDYGYVVAINGSRWAAIYPQPSSLREPASDAARLSQALERREVETIRSGAEPAGLDPRTDLPGWLVEAVDHPGVELAAVSFRPGRVHVFNKAGSALITRTDGPTVRHAVYQRPDRAVFEHDGSALHLGGDAASDSRAWLQLTANDRYPDFVPQIAAMFDSERAGNIVLFAAEGWDFSVDDPAGGHGSVVAGDMRVPMIFAGPGLQGGARIPAARNCDLMPTLLHLLEAEPILPDGRPVDIDGVDLLRSESAADVSKAER